MKKIISILLALAMLLSVMPMGILAADDAPFKDMDGSEYYAKSAEKLSELEIIKGYEDGTYGADKTVTRAEMAAIVCRILGRADEAEEASGETGFTDVPEDHWASGYINIAVEAGIIKGDGDGKFRPEDEVKYEEAIKMIVCALGYGEDIEIDPEDWSKGYIEAAEEKGITLNLKGKKGEPATRGDIAVMVVNGLEAEIAAPVASIKGGTYSVNKLVKLTSATEGAEIYYTTDGSVPTAESTRFTSSITISKTTTLKAVAILDGVLESDILTEIYTIKKTSGGGFSSGGGGGGGGGGSTTERHTVSFDLNYEGATGAPENQRVKDGKKAEEPAAPVREGYTFLGWSEDKEGGEFFDFDTEIEDGIKLYAIWERSRFTVSFDLNYEGAADAPEAQNVNKGSLAIAPTAPVRDGYVFLGWSTSEEEDVPFDFETAITGDITLFAIWAVIGSDDSYRVTFILNDGSAGAYEMQTVQAYGYATRPADPERELFTFTGWYTEEETLNLYDFSTRVTSDLILYAGWGAPDGEDGLYAGSSGGGTEYSITGIEMLENQVSVTINADDAAVLAVKFLNEETEEIIASVATETPDYCELVPVVITVEDELPEHYIIEAELYDGEGQMLCPTFTCINYTSSYEEFAAQTINDFEEDRVVSFNGEESNNFGVLNESVIRVQPSDSTNVLSVERNEAALMSLDEEEEPSIAPRIYVFENADESITSLQVGDSVYIEGTSYLFKVGSIDEINGKIFITESEDVEIQDFYSVLKVNMEVDSAPSEDGIQLMWDIVDSEPSFTIGGDINITPNDNLTITGGIEGTGKIKLEITYDIRLFRRDYFYIAVISSLELDVNLGIEVSTGNDPDGRDVTKIVLAKIDVPTPVPGLTVEISPQIPLEWEISAGINFQYNTKIETGFTYSSDDGKQNIDKKTRTVKIQAEGKAEVKFGPEIKISVQFLNGVLDAGITAGAGIKATAETSIGHEGTDAESVHDCTLCIEGTVKWYAEVYAELSYKVVEDLIEGSLAKWYLVNAEGDFPISPNFYFSLINDEDSVLEGRVTFGWGSCPNEAFRTRFLVKDEDGNAINGVNVSVTKQNGHLSENREAPFVLYLYNGTYTAEATIDGEHVDKSVVVSGEAQEVELTAESNDGSVFGVVYDAETGGAIEGATIIISQNGSIVTTTTSGEDGTYQVALGDGRFSIETTKEGYIPFNEYVSITNDAVTYLQPTMLEPGDADAKGGFAGRVINNVNGEAIEGVNLVLREGWNNSDSGEVIEILTTDENGNFLYEIKTLFGVPVELPVGNYTLTATKEGYAITTHNIVVRPEVVTTGQDFSMSPTLGDGKYRFILSWGVSPRDLDSHLTGPMPDGSRFHLYYPLADTHNRNQNRDLFTLDLDDVTSYGPETTTIHTPVDGIYNFYIYNYSGEGSYATSQAQVEVYKGDQIIAVYNAPLNQGNGRYWNVFSLDTRTDRITPINTVTSSPVSSASAMALDEEKTLEEIINEDLAMIEADIANAPKGEIEE